MQEQLLGHLLGALDDCEQEAVKQRLKSDPALRRELALARQRFEPLEAGRYDFVPPPGLAQRTCRVAALRDRREHRLPEGPAAAGSRRRPMSPQTAPPNWGGRIRWLDVAVAAGIFAAAALLIFPAIQNSRFHSRLVGCQDNLWQLGLALTQYSELHDDYFPSVPARGKLAAAGIYAPLLLRDNLLTEVRWVICPGSSLAGRERVRVPSLGELRAASEEKLDGLRRWMGGSYGYCFGHMRDGVYQATKNLRRTHFALMADAPSTNLPGYQSLNHGGRGQNVLFEDGRVRFLISSRLHEYADDFYANDYGLVSAGVHPDDSVIAPSAASPIVYVNNCANDY